MSLTLEALKFQAWPLPEHVSLHPSGLVMPTAIVSLPAK